jgi:hypothetical protein
MVSNDPDRPVFLSLGMGTVDDTWAGAAPRNDYPQYTEGTDILGMDVFPVSAYGGTDGSPDYIRYGVDSLDVWATEQKPVWASIETGYIFNGSNKPTPSQVRPEVWMALINGARGIVYTADNHNPDFTEAALLADTEMLDAVTAVNLEVLSYAPVLNTPSLAGGVTIESASSAEEGSGFAYMLKQADDGASYYLFTENGSPNSVDYTITIDEYIESTASVEVPAESRTFIAESGAFTESYAPYEVRIYHITEGPVGVVAEQPERFELSQNFPNPFNNSTTIQFSLPGPSENVELVIFNLAGQKVATVAQGWYGAGLHTVSWNGRNENGLELASGVYIYRIRAGSYHDVKKLTLIR